MKRLLFIFVLSVAGFLLWFGFRPADPSAKSPVDTAKAIVATAPASTTLLPSSPTVIEVASRHLEHCPAVPPTERAVDQRLAVLLNEPLLVGGEVNLFAVENDEVSAGSFRGTQLAELAPLAAAGDAEAQLIVGVNTLRRIPVAWADRFAVQDIEAMAAAESMVHEAYRSTGNENVLYLLHEAYRYAVHMAWINQDKVTATERHKLQQRYVAYKALLATHASDRQYLQSQIDDLADANVTTASGLLAPLAQFDGDPSIGVAISAEMALPETASVANRDELAAWVQDHAENLVDALACAGSAG